MTNRTLLIAGAVVLVAVLGGGLGYWVYTERHRGGLDITVGRDGVSIQGR